MEADGHNRLWAPRAVALVADTTQPRLSIEADRAARVLMRKSPETQRTYQGIYARFAGWLAERDGIAEASPARSPRKRSWRTSMNARLSRRRRRSRRNAPPYGNSRSICTSWVDRRDGDPDGRDPDRHRHRPGAAGPR